MGDRGDEYDNEEEAVAESMKYTNYAKHLDFHAAGVDTRDQHVVNVATLFQLRRKVVVVPPIDTPWAQWGVMPFRLGMRVDVMFVLSSIVDALSLQIGMLFVTGWDVDLSHFDCGITSDGNDCTNFTSDLNVCCTSTNSWRRRMRGLGDGYKAH